MASICVIFTSTYHTKQLNPWPNSSASRVVNYSQLSACQGDMQSFEGDPYTHGCLTSLRNKPQQKQPEQLSASIPGCIVSQRVRLLFDGEKCVLLLCACKPPGFSQIWSQVMIVFQKRSFCKFTKKFPLYDHTIWCLKLSGYMLYVYLTCSELAM